MDQSIEGFLKSNGIRFNTTEDITELNLSSSRLTELPESIGELINLRELDVFFNNLSELPESMCKLVGLKKLILPSGFLKDVLYIDG